MKTYTKNLGEIVSTIILIGSLGCSSEKIIQKIYQSPRSWVEIYKTEIYNGKEVVQTKMPILIYDDEDFILKTKNNKGEIKEYFIKNKKDFEKFYVGEIFNYNSNIIKKDLLFKRRLSKNEFQKYKK